MPLEFKRLQRRVIDVVLGIVLLILSSPIMLVSVIAIKLDDGGPVLFKQERIGTNGVPFTLWKLRTMREDHRTITRTGAWLRLLVFDEIPNILNVVMSLGTFSLSGPRPWIPKEDAVSVVIGSGWEGRHNGDGVIGWASPAAQTGHGFSDPRTAEWDQDFEEHWTATRHLCISVINFILPFYGKRRLYRPEANGLGDYPWPLRSRQAKHHVYRDSVAASPVVALNSAS